MRDIVGSKEFIHRPTLEIPKEMTKYNFVPGAPNTDI